MKKKIDLSDLVTKDFLETKLEQVDEKARDYRDEILTKVDEAIGELQTMREENIVGTYQIRELRKTQAKHEIRIKKLEQHQAT